MSIHKKFIAFLFAFWAGLISAISFLEAWLKFRANGVTREIGLSIGSLVFTVLNRIELLILLIVWVLFFQTYRKRVFSLSSHRIMFWLLNIILLMQSLWLLPQLLQRAEQIIAGDRPSGSAVHLIFILFETSKLVLLIALSFKVLNNNEKFLSQK
ncbi:MULTISPECIES: hypothetical protein [unclassified Saccharicrinis]|uniref:hypothetical protein n=1 Tax=unclassified Saccharicrinis TaxID=2646859 RepID=UPI003D34BF1F